MARACHTPWKPLPNYPSGHLGGLATPWSAEERLNGQYPLFCTCQNCSQQPPAQKTGKASLDAESSFMSPRRPYHKELNWTELMPCAVKAARAHQIKRLHTASGFRSWRSLGLWSIQHWSIHQSPSSETETGLIVGLTYHGRTASSVTLHSELQWTEKRKLCVTLNSYMTADVCSLSHQTVNHSKRIYSMSHQTLHCSRRISHKTLYHREKIRSVTSAVWKNLKSQKLKNKKEYNYLSLWLAPSGQLAVCPPDRPSVWFQQIVS